MLGERMTGEGVRRPIFDPMRRALFTTAILFAAPALHAQWIGGGVFSTALHFQACAFHDLDSGLFVYGADNPGPNSFATEGGLILTDNGDASGGYYLWYEPSTNLEDIDVKMTGGKPLYMAAGHELYGTSIVVRSYAFPDYPFAFDSVRTGTGQYYRAIRLRNDLVAFAGGGDDLGNGIIDMSTDTGATWANVAVLTGQPVARLHFVNDTLGFAATGGYRRLIGNGLFLPDSGAVYRTVNGGLDWEQVLAASGSGFSDVSFRDASTGAATRNDGTIQWTTDGGDTWNTAVVGLGVPVVMTTVTFRQDGVGFAAGYRADGVSGYILISYDGGATWYENFNTSGLNHSRRIYDLYFHDAAHGYASTHIKPLRTTGIVMGVDEPRSEALRVHPDPAEDRVFVQLPTDAPVRVDVMDATGRVVRTERAEHGTACIDVHDLPSGGYVVRATVGGVVLHAMLVRR